MRRPAQRLSAVGSTHSEAVALQAAEPSEVEQPQQGQDDKSISTSSVWEIDFCSRPLLDERGKKVWELLICDPERNFEYAEFFPNSKINSAEVRDRVGLMHQRPHSLRTAWLSEPGPL